MRKMKGIRLESEGEGEIIEKSFGPHGLLFLTSSPGGLALAHRPSHGQLIYALFFRCGRETCGISLNPSTYIGDDNFAESIAPGDRISIGMARYLISYTYDPCQFRTRGGMIAAIAIATMVALAVLALVLPRGLQMLAKSPSTFPSPLGGEGGVRGGFEIAPKTSIATYVTQAREHLRRGNLAQARLSLMEATSVDPDNEEAKWLLQEVEKDGSAAKTHDANGDTQIADREEEVRKLLRSGILLKEKGDLIGAKTTLEQVEEIAKDGRISPALASSIGDTKRDIQGELMAAITPRVKAIDEAIRSAGDLDAPTAAQRLLAMRHELDDISKALPSDNMVAETVRRSEAMLKSAAGRWFASAEVAERLSGCAKALPMYTAIVSRLDGIGVEIAAHAREGVRRCGGQP